MKSILLLCAVATISCEELAKDASRGQLYYAPVAYQDKLPELDLGKWEGVLDQGVYGQRYDGSYNEKVLVGGKQLRYGEGIEKLTYDDHDYSSYILGRHGLAFENRLARADGLRQPLTPTALKHVGYRTRKDEEKFVPLQ